MMWSSTDTTLASAGSTETPSGQDGVVRKVDPHAQQRHAVGLALGVAPEADGHAAPEGAVQHELESKHVGREVALDGPGDERAEVVTDTLGRHLPDQRVIRGAVVGEEADIADVALVAGAH